MRPRAASSADPHACPAGHRRRIAGYLFCMGVVVSCADRTAAEDDVVWLRTQEGGGAARVVGQIIDYSGEKLVLRHRSGRQEAFPASRVQEIQTTWNADCQRGDEWFLAGDYTVAAAAYRQALATEPRSWAKRRVLAQLVWCLRFTGQILPAAEGFRHLYRSDPTTPHFAAIPLTWMTAEPAFDFQRKAEQWLEDRSSPIGQLVAASWLLSTVKRSEALRVLGSLHDQDPRISFLAEAQLWRTRIGTVTIEEVSRWQGRVAEMPAEIRAGPWYTVGRAWAQKKHPQNAALAYLRVPIQHGADRDLAARSLLAAGEQLEEMDQVRESRVLYREVVTDYPETAIVDEARRRLSVTESVTESAPGK